MKLPGTTTEGVHSLQTADRQLDAEQLHYDLTTASQALSTEQQIIFNRAGGELEQQFETELRSGLTGRRSVRYHVLNDNEDTERDCFFMTGWGQTVDDPRTAQAVQLLAAKHEKTRFVIPTTPGLSGTDRLPQSVLRGLRKGSFEGVGEYMLEALRPARKLDNPLDIYAYSQGSSVGVGMGAESEKDEVRNIRVVDPAALQRRSIIGMLIASQLSGAHAKQIETSLGNDEALAFDTAKTKRSFSTNEIGILMDMYIRYPTAMGRAALWPDAERAVAKISGDITALIGENSEYNKMKQVKAALSRTALVGTGMFRLGTFNGFHSSIVANVGSLAALA